MKRLIPLLIITVAIALSSRIFAQDPPLTTIIDFNDLVSDEVVSVDYYLPLGLVLHPVPTGYLYGAPTRQRDGQALWAHGDGINPLSVELDFFLPNTQIQGEIKRFYVYVRAPGGWAADYFNANGAFEGRYMSTEEGFGTSFAEGMALHKMIITADIPWSELSIDDLQYSVINPVPEPTIVTSVLGGVFLIALRRLKAPIS